MRLLFEGKLAGLQANSHEMAFFSTMLFCTVNLNRSELAVD
jgi:hypothetical protein